jgi:membrane-bound lytic murein transglycosylase B
MDRPVGIGGDPEVTERIALANRRLRLLTYLVLVLVAGAALVAAMATVASLSRLTSQSEQLESRFAEASEERAVSRQALQKALDNASVQAANDIAEAEQLESLRLELLDAIEAD